MNFTAAALELVLRPERKLRQGRCGRALRLWWHVGIFLLDTPRRKT
jgi:hypothetical protein